MCSLNETGDSAAAREGAAGRARREPRAIKTGRQVEGSISETRALTSAGLRYSTQVGPRVNAGLLQSEKVGSVAGMDARGVLGSRRAQEDGAETAPDLLGGEDLDGVDVGVAVGGGGVDFDGGGLAGFEAEGAQ
jgi:hypothetical protein